MPFCCKLTCVTLCLSNCLQWNCDLSPSGEVLKLTKQVKHLQNMLREKESYFLSGIKCKEEENTAIKEEVKQKLHEIANQQKQVILCRVHLSVDDHRSQCHQRGLAFKSLSSTSNTEWSLNPSDDLYPF